MKDRIPLYPGRVKLTPVAGQENTYDMVRADQPTQEGDPLNKGTLLSDSVAELFGLSADAVPNDVFRKLSKSILYSGSIQNIYLRDLKQGDLFSIYESTFIKVADNYNNNDNYTLVLFPKIEDTVQWSSASGKAYSGETLDTYLENTFYNSLPDNTKSNLLSVNIKCYSGANKSSALAEIQRKVFAPSFAELYDSSLTSDGNFIPGALEVLLKHQGNAVWLRTPNTNAEAYRNSKSSGTYRSDAKTDNSWFSAFAVLSSDTLIETKYLDPSYNLPNGETVPMVKIEVGSYTGTGAWGNNNKTGYTFNIIPELVVLFQYSGAANSIDPFVIIKRDITSQNYGGVPLWITWETNRVSWDANNEIAQFNVQGKQYHVVGITKG